MDKKPESYSQFGQDLWVLEKTKKKQNGFFVEAGAGDGINLSNTYLLEKEYGWSGICIEPSRLFESLIKNRQCACINSCLSNKVGEADFFEDHQYEGNLSALTEFQIYKHRGGDLFTTSTVPLVDVLDANKCPTTIDYLSLDTEGSELVILKDFPFDKYDIRILTIEHNHVQSLKTGLRNLLTRNGYKLEMEVEVDDCYVRE